MNIFKNIPTNLDDEIFETLVSSKNVKVERIISNGQVSPDGFWYDQDDNEWVIVLQGEAEIEFEDRKVRLKTGDYVNITAHQKHRVSFTASETIWLAVFY